MIDADDFDINASIEANRQSLLRKEAREATHGRHRMMHHIPDGAEFDVVGGIVGGARLLRLRDPHAAIVTLPDGDPYGL